MVFQLVKTILNSPSRVTILGFMLVIIVGTFLLMLPQATTGKGLELVDALFTATSAVCVTGLSTIDISKELTEFGQIVVLLLIQTGGLGIMSMSTLFIVLAGKRLSLLEYTAIQDTYTHDEVRSVRSLLKDLFFFTFFFEAIGALLLSISFYPSNTFGRAIYLSIFHSISAFCNAGFSLFSDSFCSFKNSIPINLTIAFLIIMGGIGFLVLSELKQYFKLKYRTMSRLSLHSKIVISSTLILLIVSTIGIMFMENGNTLASLSTPDKWLASFFQAVNTRTAGFNSIPIGNMANETLFFIIILMFIGASPGSCGGGIKNTTFATLVLLGWSRLRGEKRPQIFNRSISEKSIGKAVSILIIAISIVMVGLMLLLMSEVGNIAHTQCDGKFMEIFFEVISAFGTVGLSTGITPMLSVFGKLIITIIMFVGRLGPLLIAMAISRSTKANFYYAEEDIMIG